MTSREPFFVALDLETTSADPTTARIVEVAVVSEASGTARRWLVNPGVPIPAEASAVHAITDEMVADAPTFAEVLPEIDLWVAGADLVGFNIRAFDLPVLRAEYERAGRTWGRGGRVIDAFVIYRERERRDLSAAVRFYCGREHVGAHGARADALATLEVLRAQIARYGLPEDAATLDAMSGGRGPDWASECGRVRWDAEGHAVFAFGKHSGVRVIDTPRDYLAWIVDGKFPADVRGFAVEALAQRPVLRVA